MSAFKYADYKLTGYQKNKIHLREIICNPVKAYMRIYFLLA